MERSQKSVHYGHHQDLVRSGQIYAWPITPKGARVATSKYSRIFRDNPSFQCPSREIVIVPPYGEPLVEG